MVTSALTANLAVQGTGTFPELAKPLFSNTYTNDDVHSETYVVNANTTTTALNLTNIVAGQLLWVTTDQPISVTITQTTDRTYDITGGGLLAVTATFTALKLANASLTTAANVVIVAVGNRVVNPGTPGIY